MSSIVSAVQNSSAELIRRPHQTGRTVKSTSAPSLRIATLGISQVHSGTGLSREKSNGAAAENWVPLVTYWSARIRSPVA
jgi:hypothetical protein